LLRAGLLASDWTTVGGRRRRAYQLTPAGRKALVDQQRTWQGFSGAVQSVLKGVPWPSPS
jgi:PadR family transcriptional regulator, regulatory protein PadR